MGEISGEKKVGSLASGKVIQGLFSGMMTRGWGVMTVR